MCKTINQSFWVTIYCSVGIFPIAPITTRLLQFPSRWQVFTMSDLFFITSSNSPTAMTYGRQTSRGLFWIVIDNWELGDKLLLQAEVEPNQVTSYNSGSKTPIPITDLDIESITCICSLSALHCLLLILFFQILHYAQSKPSVLMNYKGHSENAYTIIFTHMEKKWISRFLIELYSTTTQTATDSRNVGT